MASNINLQKLDPIQNQALRISSGAFRTSPVINLHVDSAIFPLQHHRNCLILIYFQKLLSQPQHLNTYRIKTTSPFSQKCQQLLLLYNINEKYLHLNVSTSIFRKFITPNIISHLQDTWNMESSNKLQSIKPIWESWKTSFHRQRSVEKIITRLRIGHSFITHKHLFSKLPPPICDSCDVLVDIEHLLNFCIRFNDARNTVYNSTVSWARRCV